MMNDSQLSPGQQETAIKQKFGTKDFASMLPSREQLLESMNSNGKLSNQLSSSDEQESQTQPVESKEPDLAVNDSQDKQVEFAPIERHTKSESDEMASKYDENTTSDKDFSETELRALDKGWKPKNVYTGPGDQWVSAREFLVRSKMIEDMSGYKKEISRLSKAQEALLDLVKKQAKTQSTDRAEEYLKKKRAAISEGDIEAAEQYEQKYHEEKQEVESFKDLELKTKAHSYTNVDPEAIEFSERNKDWFNSKTPENAAMFEYAIRKDKELSDQYPHWPVIKRLEEVEKMVKRFFSDKFENPQRSRASLVETARRRPAVQDPDNITYNDLPYKAKKIVDGFMNVIRPLNKKAKQLSRDEYARELLRTGAVKYE